ncbi:MAG TPA: response regulator transcription factor [Patescibacteria group bacterium]|nr:response regulator transcription factor [Patescibacteria group bacterium]
MRVLVVEDEHKIANSIKTGLEQEKLAVDVAYDGTDGYDLASSEEYDVIVLDRLLPGMEGAEFTKKLREKKNHTPIIMLTAKGQIADRVEGLNSGADDYLVKPFAFEELLARLHALTRRPKQTLDETLKVSDLTLNTRSFEVARAGKSISLSSREFALLEYLMRHPGQILSKDQIINHVWNYESNILPNTVEVYIGYLRGKIDKPHKMRPQLIHTIRGFGYKIGSKG